MSDESSYFTKLAELFALVMIVGALWEISSKLTVLISAINALHK